MTRDNKLKDKPVYAVISTGTALGTATSIIDTSGYENIQVMALHAGTGGSRTLLLYANAGTQYGTSSSTLPNPILVGSKTSDFAGLGTPVWVCGSLTHQAVLCFGTSSNLSFSASYKLFD